MRAAAALAFAVALWMRAEGRGGSEDEQEEVDEAEDEGEVVDAGWAVMWAVAGLWAASSHSGAGVGGSGSSGVCAGGVCGPLGGPGVPRGGGLPSVGVCGLSSVGGGEGWPVGGSVAGVCRRLDGWGRPVSRGPGLCAMVGVCGSPGEQREGRGRGGDCAVGRAVSGYVSALRRLKLHGQKRRKR